MSSPSEPSTASPPPPRAFTQGVGTVFQFVGGIFFFIMMFICCSSSLLSRNVATQSSLNEIGWRIGSIFYSGQMAITISVFAGVLLGLALAGVGLGLQAQTRFSPWLAVVTTVSGTLLWIVQTLFAITVLHSWILSILGAILIFVFGILAAFAVGALREMLKNPIAVGPTIVDNASGPTDDETTIELKQEVEERMRRLEVQQKEIEMLERRIKRRREEL